MIKYAIHTEPQVAQLTLEMVTGESEVGVCANGIRLLTFSLDGDVVRRNITNKEEREILLKLGFKLDKKNQIVDWSLG